MAAEALLLITLMIGLGMACARWRLLPDNSAEVLNRVALTVCLPAAVLRFASQLSLDSRLLTLVAIPWLLLLAVIALITLLRRQLRLQREEEAVLLLCIPLGNTSFLGYPLIEALLGQDGLPYAVAYDQIGSFIILSTWGLWVLARYSGDSAPTAREIAARVLRFPPFIALLLALTLMPASPPPALAQVLARLSDALLPIVTLAIGLQLRFHVPRRDRLPLLFGLSCKLLLMPALALALCALFGMQGTLRDAAVLESAMAPMITASALAISHRLAPGLAAAMVGFGTPLSLLTLFGWRWLLGAGS